MITALAVFLWVKNIVRTSSYGLSIPFQIGGFAGAFCVPGIFWLVYYLIYRQKTNNSGKVEHAKVDHSINKDNHDLLTTDISKINEIKNKINELKNNGILTEEEATQKVYQLNEKFKDDTQAKEELKKKQQLKSSLDSLKAAGILTQTEYDKKINELFSQKSKNNASQKGLELPKRDKDEFNWGEIV